jgi:hypothetical protein
LVEELGEFYEKECVVLKLLLLLF